jgi:DNA invertase Pin-like site-specific DNA recombinase
MKIGYARVSRKDQNLNLQIDALRAAGCDQIFKDKLTGATMSRPGLDRAMAALRPGDEFVVWKFDRYGRTMLESMLLALDLERRGISFRSLTESFDTKTAIGKGVMAFVAAIAEDERERLIRRTREGMAAARRRGVAIGRPRKLSAKQVEQARMWIGRGDETATRAAARLGVDVTTLRRALKGNAG